MNYPTVPEGHEHRVTTPENPRKIPRTPAEPRRDPVEPSERPRRALGETPAEPSERQISSESLAEGCAPRMVTLRNFRKLVKNLPGEMCKWTQQASFLQKREAVNEEGISETFARECTKVNIQETRKSADCKRGHVKKRQKVSKSFSTLFDNFRAGQKTSKIVKKRQKVFRHFSTIFARHHFSGPFWGALRKGF